MIRGWCNNEGDAQLLYEVTGMETVTRELPLET